MKFSYQKKIKNFLRLTHMQVYTVEQVIYEVKFHYQSYRDFHIHITILEFRSLATPDLITNKRNQIMNA